MVVSEGLSLLLELPRLYSMAPHPSVNNCQELPLPLPEPDKDRRLRVLSLPGRNFKGNAYFRLFRDGLDAAGLKVVDRRILDALRLRFDIIHVHFPEHYVTEHNLGTAITLSFIYMSLFLAAKARRRCIVWSIHDVLPFKRRHLWLLKPFMRLFHSLVDGHVFLNPSSQREFYKNFPSAEVKPFSLIAHGPYPVNEPTAAALQARRRAFVGEENAFVVGVLGNIKRYKNIGALKWCPKRLSNGRPVRIVVAGKKDAECGGEVEEALAQIESNRLIHLDVQLSDSILLKLFHEVAGPATEGKGERTRGHIAKGPFRLYTDALFW